MKKKNELFEVVVGIILILALNIVALLFFLSALHAPLTAIFPSLKGSYGIPFFMAATGGLSFYQLLYAIPLYVWFRRRRSAAIAKGITLGAVLTALLCGACFLVFLGP